jgi:hypothetical protein
MMKLIDADVLKEHIDKLPALPDGNFAGNHSALKALINMQPTIEPSAQPEPLSDAYMNAVLTWLIDYQIKAAELKGRYTPYEVLSWVVNDWRKEHERSDKQTDGN